MSFGLVHASFSLPMKKTDFFCTLMCSKQIVSRITTTVDFFLKKNHSVVKNPLTSGLPVTASFAFAPIIMLSDSV